MFLMLCGTATADYNDLLDNTTYHNESARSILNKTSESAFNKTTTVLVNKSTEELRNQSTMENVDVVTVRVWNKTSSQIGQDALNDTKNNTREELNETKENLKNESLTLFREALNNTTNETVETADNLTVVKEHQEEMGKFRQLITKIMNFITGTCVYLV
jgi:hypothetical protein